MDIHLRTFDQLATEELSVWGRTQATNDQLDSPFFRPEFAAILHGARKDVEVAVITEKGFPIAFFPFHRVRRSLGRPLGLSLGEFQGVVQTRAFKGDAVELVKACGISVWDYSRVQRSQVWCQEYEQMSTGFEAYCEMLRHRGSNEMQEADKNYHRIERDVGAVKLVLNYHQEDMLTSFLRWKEQEAKTTGLVNRWGAKWIEPTLRAALQEKQMPFMGICAGLYAGNQLVAVEIGLRSQQVYQSLGGAFDPNYLRYAPSQSIRFTFLRWAAEHGIQRIDLGHGKEEYKIRLATGEHMLAEGSIAVTPFTQFTRSVWWKVRKIANYPALKGPASLLHKGYSHLLRHWEWD